MLYQVATGWLGAGYPNPTLRSILSRQANVDVLSPRNLAWTKRTGWFCSPKVPCLSITWSLATGIQYNYFGHNEWKEFAPGLASLDEAGEMREKLLRAFEEAERLAASDNADPAQFYVLLTFVLVGAGTVGVEMAGTLAEMARMALVRDFRTLIPVLHGSSFTKRALEFSPPILRTFHQKLVAILSNWA